MLFYVFILAPVLCDGAKILGVFPAPCHSHQFVFRALTLELVRRGHDVTVITPFPAYPNTTIQNLTEINIGNTISKIVTKDLGTMVRMAKDEVTVQHKVSLFTLYKIFEGLFENELKDFLKKNEQYDIILGEMCARMTLIFSHIYKAPFIQISSLGGFFDTFHRAGGLDHPFIYPTAVGDKFTDLSLLDKAWILFDRYRMFEITRQGELIDDKLVRKHLGPDFPSSLELRQNVDMIFINMHHLWDTNRPVPPNVVHLGGLHLQPPKQLPDDLQSLLDKSPNSIFMSFGSTIRPSLFDQKKLQIFLDVLSTLPYTIFFKWDTNIDVAHNIVVRKWYPQADLLRHPNIKLFITQAGLQSIDEAVEAEVPMLAIPILWDQFYNAHKIVELKLGAMCNIKTISRDDFRKAIEEVLSNKSYRENVKKYKATIHDQPQTSLERAVWWTEYVIRNKGAKHLKTPAFEMSLTDYYEMTFVLSMLAVSVAIFLTVMMILSFCFKLLKYLNIFGKIKLE
ncbi:unnamed protein product [Colias eurytheme]|nr:unnamed protein product [Colias eurytheme]